MDSILNSVKKVLGIAETYDAFDVDIVMHINTVFTILADLGIGPEEGFSIVDDTTTWDAFLGTDPRKNSIKTLVYLRVRLLFDPPTTSYLIEAMEEQIRELTWRISSHREDVTWQPETE